MTQILYGDRVGRKGTIRIGCAAVILDETGEKVLLTRRVDNGQWCLPSGAVEPGESVSEACEREVREETGLEIKVKRLTSVFSSPDRLVIYDEGKSFQFVSLNFEVELISGIPALSDETSEVGFFPTMGIEKMDIFLHHLQFIKDTLACQDAVFIR